MFSSTDYVFWGFREMPSNKNLLIYDFILPGKRDFLSFVGERSLLENLKGLEQKQVEIKVRINEKESYVNNKKVYETKKFLVDVIPLKSSSKGV